MSIPEAEKKARLGKNYIYPWVGIDLDGTLAEYHEFQGPTHIGAPIEKMVNRVKKFLLDGVVVKIFTARAAEANPATRIEIIEAIDKWCIEVFGQTLTVTCMKDYGMVRLYDDRAIQIIKNTGERADGEEL
jgi:hypothetical protein